VGELDAAIGVAFPLRGEWVAFNSPADRIPSHGTDMLGQRYAFDFMRLDEETRKRIHPAGTLRTYLLGVPTRECFSWGQPIHAALDGEVIAALDGVSERRWIHVVPALLGVLWTALTFNPSRGFASVAGNHVVIRSGETYAAYAHLAPGSVAVAVGDDVRAGDLLGRVGHTGNSTAPHLHFQLMNVPDPMTASGIACSFDSLEIHRDGRWEAVRDLVPGRDDRIRSTHTG